MVRALRVVSQKIEKKEIDEVRQKNFSKALTIIYTIQTNLNFDKELKNFYQVCPKEMLDKLDNPITNKKIQEFAS